jgi:hypothetical protein
VAHDAGLFSRGALFTLIEWAGMFWRGIVPDDLELHGEGSAFAGRRLGVFYIPALLDEDTGELWVAGATSQSTPQFVKLGVMHNVDS